MKHRASASAVALIFAATVGCGESTPTQPIAMPDDALSARQATTGIRILTGWAR